MFLVAIQVCLNRPYFPRHLKSLKLRSFRRCYEQAATLHGREFKLAAVKQVTERHYPVAEVAERLGVSSHSLYAWIKRYSQPEVQQQHDSSQQAEIRRLKAELRRVTDERDILKKAAVDSIGPHIPSADCVG